MKSVTTTIITEATFSDDNRHRYALKKVWNDKRPLALIVSKSAGSDDGVFETLTQSIITNNLYKLGYGGFCLCNLFSSINGKDSDKDNIQLIKELANSKDYPDIIICWGCLSASKESIQEQAIKVVNILANVKKKNIYTVSNGIATNCHPLSPSVRKSFDIVPFEFASEEGVKAE